MPVNFRTVTGPLLDIMGEGNSSAILRFTPQKASGNGGTVLIDTPVEVVPDESDGTFSIDLAVNTSVPYDVELIETVEVGQIRYPVGSFFVPAGAAIPLYDLLSEYVPPTPPVPTVTELNAAVLASQANADRLEELIQNSAFASRAELVTTRAGGFDWPVGAVVSAGSMLYEFDGVSTVFSDLPGLKPYRDIFPDLWKQNGDGVNMTSAFLSAFDYLGNGHGEDAIGGVLHLLAAKYLVSNLPVQHSGIVIRGVSRWSSQILTTSPVGDLVKFSVGASGTLFGVGLQHVTLGVAPGVKRTDDYMVSMERCRVAGMFEVYIKSFDGGVRIHGCHRIEVLNVWGQNNANSGRTEKARRWFSFEYDSVNDVKCTTIRLTNVDVAVAGGMGAEVGYYIETSDGIYLDNIHANLCDIGMEIATSAGVFIGSITLIGSYLDEATGPSLKLSGNGIVKNLKIGDTYFRKSGTNAFDADDTVIIEVLNMDGGEIRQAKGRAINIASTVASGINISNVVLAGNLTDAVETSEVFCASKNLTYVGNTHIGGYAAASCIKVPDTDGLPMIAANNFSESECGTRIDADYTDGAGLISLMIDNETAKQVPVTEAGGVAAIRSFSNGGSLVRAHSADILFDIDAAPYAEKSAAFTGLGASVDTVQTDVTGTTGATGRVTVAAIADALKIENQSGSPRRFNSRIN